MMWLAVALIAGVAAAGIWWWLRAPEHIHEGATEAYVPVLRTITEEMAAVPAEDDPAVHQTDPVAEEPVGPVLPPWHELPAAPTEVPALYQQIGPAPRCPLEPDELSHTHQWTRGGLLDRIRARKEAQRG